MSGRGKQLHFKGDICTICKKRPVGSAGKNTSGNIKYRAFCGTCYHKFDKYGGCTYRQYKKSKCQYCGFVAIDPCQLDVDHIDNNHKNNNAENLQTLCANCHRLKSYLARKP